MRIDKQSKRSGGRIEDSVQASVIVWIFGELPGCGFVDVFVSRV